MEIVKFALTLHYIVDINKYIYFIDIVNQTQYDLFYFLFLIEVEDDKVYFYTNTTYIVYRETFKEKIMQFWPNFWTDLRFTIL